MIEKKFVQEGINKAKIEEYLQKELRRANYSHMEFTRTPTSTNIVIWSEKPSLVIGRGGRRINEIIDDFEHKFGIENPQVDAREVEEPDLDANVVAKNVAGWLEKGGHPKRVGYTYLRRVMDAGAVGVQIEISGKLSGSRGRSEKFNDGYVKKCGDTANQYVEESYEKAVIKAGALGVKVKIMKDLPRYMERALERQRQARQRRLDDEAGTADEEEEESADHEPVEEIDADEIAAMTVDDTKEAVRDEEFDPRAVLKAEQEGKARKTLVEWLEGRVDAIQEAVEEEPEEAGGEDVEEEDIDYDELVTGTIDDVKDAVNERDLDPAAVLEAEEANKDRVTLTEWLDDRIGGESEDHGGEDIDYDELVTGTIDDVKEAAEADDIDHEKLLEAEEANKDRVTLTDWIKARIEED